MAPPIAPQQQQQRATSGSMVTVACKLPHGLVLRLQREEEVNEPVMGGGTRRVKIHVPDAEKPTITLKGTAVEFGKAPPALMVGGFALTGGVPEDFWELWLSQNKTLDAVRSGLIFAHSARDGVEGMAMDREKQRTGLEPLDMTMVAGPGGAVRAADPRVPRSKGLTIGPATGAGAQA